MKNLQDLISPILQALEGKKSVEISELWGATKALFLSEILSETHRPIIVLTATDAEASAVLNDLRFFRTHQPFFKSEIDQNKILFPEPVLFPAWDILPFEADSPDSRTVGERMAFLYRLITQQNGIYVVPAKALMQKLLPWEVFVNSVKTITQTTQIDPEEFIQFLVSNGYEQASLVTRVGEFSRRGGIIDFFSPERENPVRLELFGSSIESLREFDAETQRSLQEIQEAVILPVRELVLTPEQKEQLSDRGMEAPLLDQIRQGIIPPGAEFLAPFFYPLSTLFNYVPENSVFVLIEPDDVRKTIDGFVIDIEKGRREEIEEGRVLPEIPELYLDSPSIENELGTFQRIDLPLLGSTAGYRMDTKSSAWLGMRLTKPLEQEQPKGNPLPGSMPDLVEKLKQLRKESRILFVSGTEEAATRLKKFFMDYDLGITSGIAFPEQDSGPWPILLATGRLSEGFFWRDLGISVITEEEIFGKKIHRPAPKKSKITPFLSTFKELKPGDFVVHADYGVGEYQGLTHINIDSIETDFLTLRYEPDAVLHVPLYSLDKVQKYIGVEGIAPKLDRLGGQAWTRTKEKIKKDILEMARQLVAIYAAREAMQRVPFSSPDNLYREFEGAFPFEETPDQEHAIEEVLSDMQRPRPMDRVVCGDVGYGKTEVALRAAFKAVEDGFQVAVLVPTTLLADQHFRTFAERFGLFSVTVDMLSRFRTKAEQQKTLRDLQHGIVDVVIGTHRLLQKDVAFKNLGLLIVDEEHKFGVRHKERIKEFKNLVDVLTLTATPIPRTLHMSLAGLRDLSIIQTPPLDRQSIQVSLARFGKRVIREAIMHELNRKGQVFFVHNRVQDIDRMAAFVRSLVPEATIGVAHGQMHEHNIEDVMSKFLSGSLNVLVTTTIIESGIDIPTANTIIINRADRFGLADLYQIKGRVGRSREKAYAYLLIPAEEQLSDIARKRLRAIQELSELGAGFQIAAQDLETRGAGNLLGKQQSGHIAAVGIDLYTEMMEQAIAELQGEEQAATSDTIITMKASAFIPEDYIQDMSLRLAAYKEISSVNDEAQLAEIQESLVDRYGELPVPAHNLIKIMQIKCLAKEALLSRIDEGNGYLDLTFAPEAAISPNKVMHVIKKHKGMITYIPEYTLRIKSGDHSLDFAVDFLKKFLPELL
ncbi:MAG: transcription-repair coupling factor [Nitrospirota bacterium]